MFLEQVEEDIQREYPEFMIKRDNKKSVVNFRKGFC